MIYGSVYSPLRSLIQYPKDTNYTEPIASLLRLLGKQEGMMNNDVGQRHYLTTKDKTNTDAQDDKDDTAVTVVAVAAPLRAAETMQGVWDNLLFDLKGKQDHQDDDDDDDKDVDSDNDTHETPNNNNNNNTTVEEEEQEEADRTTSTPQRKMKATTKMMMMTMTT